MVIRSSFVAAAITGQNELLADKFREGEESMSRLTEALRTQESKYQP
jgi:hypothetical protein